MGYENGVRLMEFVGNTSCFLLGILVFLFYNAFIMRRYRVDETLDEIAIVRIKDRNNIDRIFINPSNFSQSVVNQIIMFGWVTRISNTRKLTFGQLRRARVITFTLITLAFVYIALAALLIITVDYPPDEMPTYEDDFPIGDSSD